MTADAESPGRAFEEELLLALTSARRSAELQARVGEIVRMPGLDWEWIMRMAGIHRIRPLLHAGLDGELRQQIPAKVRSQLRAYYMYNVSRNMMLTQESLKIAAILKDNGIPSIVYKGPLQASFIYRNIALREIADVDTIIHPQDLTRAKAALQAQGYQVDSNYEKTSDEDAVANRNKYSIAMWRADREVYLELHWKVMPAHSWYGYSEDLVWQHIVPQQIGEATVNVLQREFVFALLCIHNEKHNWYGLRYLNDVAQMLKTHPDLDWEKVLEYARGWGKLSAVLITCNLCALLLGSELPEPLARAVGTMRTMQAKCAMIRAKLFSEKEFMIPSYREWWPHYRQLIDGAPRPVFDRMMFIVSILWPEYRDKRHFILLPPRLTIVYVISRVLRYIRWNWVPRGAGAVK